MFAIHLAWSNLVILTGFMIVVWLVSVKLKDASIVDRVWGLTFFIQMAYYTYASPFSWRATIVLSLVGLWGLRLSWHIQTRNQKHGEDYRYQALRKKTGPKFWIVSLFSVFLLQAGLSFVVGLPMLLIASESSETSLGMFDYLGIGIWICGFLFEAIADLQLRKFKSDPGNKGKLLTTGLWSLTRHPNYFGDALLWWGIFVISLSLPYSYFGVIGPVVMTFFLTKVTGVTLLEKDLIKKKPDYKEYILSTPAFIPKISKLWKRA
ncbi:MAG: DUF1295 domain-containing protein [Oligoflexales bacterium]